MAEAGIAGREGADEPAAARLYSLELGRFLAALLVFLCHLAAYVEAQAEAPGQRILGGAVLGGPFGLQYFFVLSGFVMVLAHHGDFGRWRAIPKFWWRRACRLYPSYWLAVAIPVAFLWGGMTPGVALHVGLLEPDLLPGRDRQEFIQAAWSMRYEVAFYLVLGLGMLPYIGKPLLGLWMVLTWWRWCWRWFPFTVLPIHPYWLLVLNGFMGAHAADFVAVFQLYFFGGLAAGLVFLKFRLGWRISAGLAGLGGAVALVVLAQEGWGTTFGTPVQSLLMGAALGAVICGVAGLERCKIFRLGRWAGAAGAMSYPLYVLHEPVMLLASFWFPQRGLGLGGGYVLFAGLLVVTLAVAALVTVGYERPVQRFLRRGRA